MDAVWDWLGGPFWRFLNAPFIAGLIPAIVGVVLARRVSDIAVSNREASAVRSAEQQVLLADETEKREQSENQGGAPSTASALPDEEGPNAVAVLTPTEVAAIDAKIAAIKGAIESRIESLDGRRRRKYLEMARYDYRPILILLEGDGQIERKDVDRLLPLLRAWSSYRRKKPSLPRTTAQEIIDFKLSPRKRRRNRQTSTSDSSEDVERSAEAANPPEGARS